MSFDRVNGAKAITAIISTTSEIVPMTKTTTATEDDMNVAHDQMTTTGTTFDSEVIAITESTNPIQSQTTLENEFDTTGSYVTNELTTISSVQKENTNVEDVLRIFPSKELEATDPSYLDIILNAPVMLVYAEKNAADHDGEAIEENDISSAELKSNSSESSEESSEEIIDPKTIQSNITNQGESIDSYETASIEQFDESTSIESKSLKNTAEEMFDPKAIQLTILNQDQNSEINEIAITEESIGFESIESDTSEENMKEMTKLTDKSIESETSEPKWIEPLTESSSRSNLIEPKVNKIPEMTVTVIVLENVTAEKHVESDATKNKNQLTENMIGNESTEKIIETERVVEVTTIAPQSNLNELKQIEQFVNGSKTKNIFNVTATTVNEADVMIPDLISTIEAINPIEVRNNKRRNSNFHANQSVGQHSPFNSKRKINSNNLSNVLNHKFISDQKKITKTSYNMMVEKEHENRIMEIHSLLSLKMSESGGKQSSANSSNSLQQLIESEKLLHRPSLGEQDHLIESTTENIQTSTQTEKTKRKYNRRVSARKFSVNSSKTTTTTTTEFPSKKVKNNISVRHRFSRRKSAQTEAINLNESTDSTMGMTKSNDQLQNNQKTSLEKRKRLFGTRRVGNWRKAQKTTTTAELANESN